MYVSKFASVYDLCVFFPFYHARNLKPKVKIIFFILYLFAPFNDSLNSNKLDRFGYSN